MSDLSGCSPVPPCVDQPTGPLPCPFVVRLYGCRVGRRGARGIGFGKGLRRNGHEKYSAAAAAVALALIQLGTAWASPPSFTRLTYSVMIVANDPSDMRPPSLRTRMGPWGQNDTVHWHYANSLSPIVPKDRVGCARDAYTGGGPHKWTGMRCRRYWCWPPRRRGP